MPQAVTYLLLVTIGLLVASPFLWLVANSFRTTENVLRDITAFWPESLYLGNFPEVFSRLNFVRYLQNTLRIVVIGTCALIASSTVVAYGFARYRTRWMGILFAVMLSTMMVPGQVTLIPVYIWYHRLHWIDTYYPLVLPAFFGGAFAIFLLRQFFLTIPRDYADAATVDGASTWHIFTHIYLPLSTAPISALAVLDFLGRWNDFFGPSVFLRTRDKFVLQQGLNAVVSGQLAGQHDSNFLKEWNLMAAGALVTTIPIIVLFFFAQRQFIEGVRLQGLKG